MIGIEKQTDKDILDKINLLFDDNKNQLLNYLEFLIKKTNSKHNKDTTETAIKAIQHTWQTIKLDKETLTYIAEDKELEYEI